MESAKSTASQREERTSEEEPARTGKMEYADIPECRVLSKIDKECMICPEEQLWCAREDDDEEWIDRYVVLGRSMLTLAQEAQLNVPKEEAMENACTGLAEQYIMDVLHKSEYVPDVAIQRILKDEVPVAIVKRWTAVESELFHQGLTRHGTNFSNIQKNFLPGKEMPEMVEFYYTWKGSEPTTTARKGRHREYLKAKRQTKQASSEPLSLQSSRVMTRSSSLARRHSKTPPRRDFAKENKDPQLEAPRQASARLAKRRRTQGSPAEKAKEKAKGVENGALEKAAANTTEE